MATPACPRAKLGKCAHCDRPTGRGKRTCSPVCAREWAREHVWHAARQVALARAGYACEDCGSLDWDVPLEVHHLVPVDRVIGYRAGCQHHTAGLRVLCASCHRSTHAAMDAAPGAQLALVLAA